MDDDHVIVETFTPAGNLISTEVFGMAGASSDGTWQSRSGSGGSSSPSGCTKVTVRNKKETLLGFTAYWFNTWTSWCWNRSSWTITNVETGFFLEDVDPLHFWQGLVFDDTRFYAWQPGYSKSGYWHEKQGHFRTLYS